MSYHPFLILFALQNIIVVIAQTQFQLNNNDIHATNCDVVNHCLCFFDDCKNICDWKIAIWVLFCSSPTQFPLLSPRLAHRSRP